MIKCFYCDAEIETLPFNCKYCDNTFCSKHRIPENHDCSYHLKKRLVVPAKDHLVKSHHPSRKQKQRDYSQKWIYSEGTRDIRLYGYWMLSGLIIFGLHFIYFLFSNRLSYFLEYIIPFILVDIFVIGGLSFICFMVGITIFQEKQMDKIWTGRSLILAGFFIPLLYFEGIGNFHLLREYPIIMAIFIFAFFLTIIAFWRSVDET